MAVGREQLQRFISPSEGAVSMEAVVCLNSAAVTESQRDYISVDFRSGSAHNDILFMKLINNDLCVSTECVILEIHGCFTVVTLSDFLSFSICYCRMGYAVGGGASFIPMKVAQWHMKPKNAWLPGLRKTTLCTVRSPDCALVFH